MGEGGPSENGRPVKKVKVASIRNLCWGLKTKIERIQKLRGRESFLFIVKTRIILLTAELLVLKTNNILIDYLLYY